MVLNDTHLLEKSILGLCREAVANTRRLEVDGIICLTFNGQDHVVKIHEFFDKPNYPENQPKETFGTAKSVARENVHQRRKTPITTYDNANKKNSDRIEGDVLIQPKPDTQGSTNPEPKANENTNNGIQQEDCSTKGTSLEESKFTTQISSDTRTVTGHSYVEKRCKTSGITQDNVEMNISDQIMIEADTNFIKPNPDNDGKSSSKIQQKDVKIKRTSMKVSKTTSHMSSDIRTFSCHSGLGDRCKTSNTTQDKQHANMNISDQIIIETDNILIKPKPCTDGDTNSKMHEEDGNMEVTSLQDPKCTTQISSETRTLAGHSGLDDKKKNMSSATNILCKICQNIFENVEIFEAHNLAAHNHSTCILCLATFTSLSNMKRHMLLNTCIKPYACKKCPKRFSHTDGLKKHLRAHTFKLRCAQCKTGYPNRTCMKNHMKKEHYSKMCHICPKCGESYTDMIKFQQHMKSHQEQERSKQHVCEKCHKVLKSPYKLREHMLSHRPKSPNKIARRVDKYFLQGSEVPFTAKAKDENLSNDLLQMETEEINENQINTDAVDHLSDNEVNLIDKKASNGCSDYLCIECNHGFHTENELHNHECNTHEIINNSVSEDQDHNKCNDEQSEKETTNPYEESTQVDSKHYCVYNDETVTEPVTCGACQAIFSVSKGLENHLKLYPDHKL
ncbi:zinc finger protein 184-like [Ruditapes philippinarum]|uniref:zinc finger protein 184-like n=1 Tax=Ruditapes philippinarum TaxID=129788 RepID=UPI00295B6451|nr:zinc finger protein 184-like [Ruditapes philippinarum]